MTQATAIATPLSRLLFPAFTSYNSCDRESKFTEHWQAPEFQQYTWQTKGACAVKSKANPVLGIALICLATSCATARPTTEEPQGTKMTTRTELLPQVLVDRLLSLIRDVKDFDELSPLVLERYLEVPFTKNSGENSGFHMLDQPSPYSTYATTYNFDEKFPRYSNVTLELIPPSSIPASTVPPCELVFEKYDQALKDAGFKTETGYWSYNEFGRVISFQYLRDNIRAQINPWHPVSVDPNRKSGENCVRSIRLYKFED
ncbi:hypothetical protein AB8Z76_21720 [Xanthomonas phaseoli pv. phaseoli]|uniref:hypothetical protein n=1 Tax=Xanthomonas phaseoli TaxID=1985254 RepID=UPI001F45F4B7|nr:hypothetical protein [Xanthomonas phaseoli]